MIDHRLVRLLALFILIMGIATPLLAFSTPAVSVAYAQDDEEGASGEESAEGSVTTGDTPDTAGAAVAGGIIALVVLLIVVVAIIGAVSLGIIGIGAIQVSPGED